jgi:hypothetical protein
MQIVLDDRRLVSRVLRQWGEMAADRHLPSKHDIRPWLVGNDWQNCALVRLAPMLEQWIFAVVGDKLSPSPDRVLAGGPISECPEDTLLGLMLSFLPRVVASGMYYTVEGATSVFGDGAILYRSVLLPLSDDGTHIDAVLVAANFRKIGESEAAEPHTRLYFNRRRAS